MAIGPLAHRPDPGSYDLCARHCEHLTAPRGWELIRIPLDDAPPEDDVDDLVALAEAVREAGFGYLDSHQPELVERSREESAEGVVEVKRKGHLTMLIDPTV